MNARDLGIITLKLGFSGAVIAAIAALFLVFSEDGEVSEAQADLYDMQPASIHQHGDFEQVIKDSGLEPRPYDYNGNFVNFAVGDSKATPAELHQYYQQKFERAGINSRVYEEPMFGLMTTGHVDNPGELKAVTDGFLQGEMVPLSVSEEHVVMAGLLSSVDPEDERFSDFKEKLKNHDPTQFDSPEQLASRIEDLSQRYLPNSSDIGGDVYEDSIDGFRYLEAHREPGQQHTNVISSWSDGDFDAHKISDPSTAGVGTDPEVPACIGCERDNRLQALDDDEPYVLNQFRTATSTPDDIAQFYERTMTQRNWDLVETDEGLSELEAHIPELQQMPGNMINFQRGEENLTVFVPDGTSEQGERSVVTLREEATP